MIEKKQKINKITKNSEKSKIDKYLGKLRKKITKFRNERGLILRTL